MTRATLRTILRRRLNEVTADNWTDSDLNEVLNLGVHRVQVRIMALAPEAFIYIARAPITALEEFVPKPVGMWYETVVRLKDESTGLYNAIQPKDYYLAVDLSPSETTTVYSHVGRHFAIRPVPAASIADGLEVLYVPTLSMGADTDVPDVHVGLHDAIIKASMISLMPETGEPYKDLKESLDEDLNEIPLYYRTSAGAAPLLNPQVPKNY